MELAKMEEKRKSALADFFKVKQISAHDRLSFFGLMVKPVQRFPQFILFLQDLLKYTPQGHHDRMSLQLALSQLELLAELLNESKREAEQYQAFKEMLGHISGTFNTRALSSVSVSADGSGPRPRYLLREDNVTHMEFNQAGLMVKCKQRRLLLLNDKVICVSVAPKQSHDFGGHREAHLQVDVPRQRCRDCGQQHIGDAVANPHSRSQSRRQSQVQRQHWPRHRQPLRPRHSSWPWRSGQQLSGRGFDKRCRQPVQRDEHSDVRLRGDLAHPRSGGEPQGQLQGSECQHDAHRPECHTGLYSAQGRGNGLGGLVLSAGGRPPQVRQGGDLHIPDAESAREEGVDHGAAPGPAGPRSEQLSRLGSVVAPSRATRPCSPPIARCRITHPSSCSSRRLYSRSSRARCRSLSRQCPSSSHSINPSTEAPAASGDSAVPSAASSPRSSKLDKQGSLDQSFTAKIRASLANSPAFHRKRFRDLGAAQDARMSKTLPRGHGSTGGAAGGGASGASGSAGGGSGSGSQHGSEQGYCDVYGLYGKLIFVKEDYDAEEGTQGNLMDMMYEGMRRSDPELAAIPGKVCTLDRRLRMKASRPRSLDLSNWSVDSKSSSLYTSSGSEESMGIRLFGGRSVSRNSSSASHKTSGTGSDLGNISENGLMTTADIHHHQQQTQTQTQHSTPNKTENTLGAGTSAAAAAGGAGAAGQSADKPAAAVATLKRKQKQNTKQQQQQSADGPRTVITLMGGRGYWRHLWQSPNSSPSHKGGSGGKNEASGSGCGPSGSGNAGGSGGSSPSSPSLTANSNDAHIVVWEKEI
ncbi:GL16418 [Drosophila persimilis]|uniref:GL16418 n=1 Tax=Drosophila persimilis TaxID=7234 RepID=B4GWK6_DROPE|nr:GL16418 [Drosophila persimilis]